MREGIAALKARAWGAARSFVRASLVGIGAGGAALVLGAPADVARGLQWLQAQVQADGTLAAQPSAGAQQQAQCQAAATLIKLAGDSPQVAALVAALQASSAGQATETVACVQQLRQQLGQIVLNSEVETRRIAGQGYAPHQGFATSSALDTGWALAAQLQQLSVDARTQLLGWLQATQAADGSFATAGRPDMVATAVILTALKDEVPRSSTAAGIAAKAAQWLLAQRKAPGQWLDDAAVTAIVFEAVHPYTSADASLAPAVEAFLLARQQADGSWSGDAYTTAVALRALALVGVPALDPSKAGLKVRFVDARTALPVPGVQLSSAAPALSAQSDAAGAIQVGNLAPGTYPLVASAGGYATVNLQASLAAGQVLDLGTLQLIVPAGANTAVVSGTVREQGSGAPIAGATVAVEGLALSATTAADGSYVLAGVTPGALTLSASKTGYLASSGSGTALAGQVLDFSPFLTPGTPNNASCRIVGQVVDAATLQPLAGVAINTAGANQVSAVTGADGRFETASLVSGLTTITASRSGYDTVAASAQLACSTVRATVVDFSPRLYANGQSPANANTASLNGVVLDARTDQPIAGAQLLLTPSSGAAKSGLSDADGKFNFAGLEGTSAQLKVQASGYEGVTITYSLQPLAALDIGQVRLRPPKVTQLLPDLKLLEVQRGTARTDAQSLVLGGAVTARIANAGTATAPAGTAVVAFFDGNGNNRYDEGTDPLLGNATLADSVAPAGTVTLSISVSGTLAFRDAPVHVAIDPAGAVQDADRGNNVMSTAAAALVTPVPSAFNPVLKWHWSGSSKFPSYNQVMMTPVVGRLLDTNGDGVIDNNDAPCVAFMTFTSYLYGSPGVLRVVHGVTGQELLTITDPVDGIAGIGGLAIADLDRDGKPEIIGVTSTFKVIAFANDGRRLWTSANTWGGGSTWDIWTAPVIADLDADGKPEIIVAKTVYNADGTRKWLGSGRNVGVPGSGWVGGAIPVVADLYGSGKQNLIVGGSVYSPTGERLWEGRDGYAAVADFDGNGQPSIVVSGGGLLTLYHADGRLRWQVGVPGSNGGGGPPTIADADGDGKPDIGVAGATAYSVFRGDGSLLWSQTSQDNSSRVTGSTFFDFDGDGSAEVLYADELKMRAMRGTTGAQLWSIPNPSGTAYEYPLVVDTNGDGRAEFVVVANNYAFSGVTGVRVYGDQNNGWVGTRSVWNQHAYSITNVNDDLTVPAQPVPSWKAHNTFRLNKRLDADPRAVPDLTVGYLRVADNGSSGSVLTFRAGNTGAYKVPGTTRFAVYNTNPANGVPPASALVGTVTLGADLAPGEWRDLNLAVNKSLDAVSASGTVWIVGDDDGTGKRAIDDFDRSNNTYQGDLRAVAIHLVPTVATDKPVYTEADLATFTAQVRNAGSYGAQTAVRFSVWDANGLLVEMLPLTASSSVPVAGTIVIASPWPVSGVLAGSYLLKAELVGAGGQVYGAATTTFQVTASQTQSALARITTDRVSYSAAQTVQLTSRVSNATSNAVLEAVEARTVVTSASGSSVFTRTEPIDQLAPTTSRQYGYPLAASGLAAGSYTAKLELVSASGAVLAQSSTSFTVLGADVTGVGLTGQLQAVPSTLFVGQGTQLTLNATNGSRMALANVPLTVRIVDPESGTVVASFTSTVADWQAGSTQTVTFPWVAAGNHNQILVAVASAQIAGKDVQLAQTNLKILGIVYTGTTSVVPQEVEAGSTAALNFTVTNPAPVAGRMIGSLAVETLGGQQLASWPLDLTIGAGSTFAGNQLYVSGEQQQQLKLVLRQQLGTGTVVLSTSDFAIIDPPVPVGVTTGVKNKARILVLVSCPPGLGTKEDAECVAQRSQAVTTYLTSLGFTAKAVSTNESFLAEMRCGAYNTYWISGGAMKLEVQTIGELKEAVRRGEALWMDGVHDSRNQLLHDAAGVKHIGKLAGSGFTAALAQGGVYQPQNLPTLGQPEKFELTTGAAQGSFAGQQAVVPAVISNDWGSGKSLLFAFDLAAMMTADVVQANAQLAGFVATSADHAATGSVTLTVGDVTQLAAQVTNQATRTVSFKAEAVLPVGLVSVGTSPAATLTPNTDGTTTATWNFTLKEGATQELTWQVRATQAGSYSTPLAIYSLPRAGSTAPPKLRASTTIGAEVQGAASLIEEPAAKINALQLTESADKQDLVKAMSAVNSAVSLHAAANYEQAIVQWLAAAEALQRITSADTTEAKRAVALALEASTDALCIQKCGSAGCQ